MDVGAILSKSFDLYKRNPNIILPHFIEYVLDAALVFILVIIGVIVFMLALGSLSIASAMSLIQGPEPFLLIAFVIFTIAVFVLFVLVLNAFAQAAVIGMVVEANRVGKTSLSTGIESAKKHGLAIFGYILAITFIPAIVFGAIIVAVVVAMAVISAGTGMGLAQIALIIFIFSLLTLAFIIIYVMALFTPQKIVIENLGAIDGIKASFGFVKGNVIGVIIFIVVWIALLIGTSLASMIFAIPSIIFEYMDQFISVFFTILENIVSITLGLLLAPYIEAVKTLMALEEVESPPVVRSS
ncbi:hypothetical protein KKA03_00080 [archaeon]|nr:hypothetical protein [archaeon]